ncbi:MAG: hypothetical protein ACP5I6_00385 [Caldisphaera sp.]|jgi:predicted P-loop ATPase/GTPase|nr:hypothetical protein [Caldisphaera sp.]PMP60821.1 MAG: hypothetical protein C0201_01680 [Caldisphaera sp.]PMP92278.1 MAG: hypothetical protein C0171_01080 [Caldisphaera sp.]
MKILIIGLLEENSGKTTFASSLISALISEGFDSVGFKPLGNTELWEHPEVLEESRRQKMVITKDSIILYKSSKEKEPINLLNPFGGLLLPVLPEKFNSLNSFNATLYSPNMRMGISRLTSCNNKMKNIHFINEGAINKSTKNIGYEILDLVSILDNLVKVDDNYLFNLISGGAINEIDKCLNYLENRHEAIVIESNSNVASPTINSINSDLVIAVTPGSAIVIDGKRFRKAIELILTNGKPWTVKTQEVIPLTNYIYSIELPLLQDQIEGYSKDSLSYIVNAIKELHNEK